MKLSIHGSCVTRDIFHEVDEESKIDWYRARASLHSLNASPIGRDLDVNLDSKFQRQCVIDDLRKTQIDTTSSDYLIVDFIDERFDIVRFHDTLATRSNEFQESFKEDYEKAFLRGSDEDYENWKLACSHFSEAVSGLPVILHRSKYAATAINRETKIIEKIADISFIENMNSRFKKYEQIFCDCIDVVGIIDVDDSLVISDSSSRWGTAPYHYIPEYYIEAYRQLVEISDGNKNKLDKIEPPKDLSHEIATYFGIGIMDHNWLHSRLNLFEMTLLSSLKSQSENNFTFNIFIDVQHPYFVKHSLDRLLSDCKFNWKICEVDSIKTAAKNGGSIIFSNFENSSEKNVIISAVDDDDFFHTEAISEIQKVASQSGEYSLISLNMGIEIDIARKTARIIKPTSIRLLLSIVSPPGKRIYSPLNFNHVTILETVGMHVKIDNVRLEDRIWFGHVKHSLSDSAYYGARYNIGNDPKSFQIPEAHQISESLGMGSMNKLESFGEDLPDGMPYKPLARGYDSIVSSNESILSRLRTSKLSRKKVSFKSEKNVLILGTEFTFKAISECLNDTPSTIKHLNFIDWPFDFSTLNSLNPDVVFLDLPTIESILSPDYEKFEEFIFDLFLICEQLFIHQIDQPSSIMNAIDAVKKMEEMKLPVEVIGLANEVKTEQEFSSYVTFLRRMFANRFDKEINQ